MLGCTIITEKRTHIRERFPRYASTHLLYIKPKDLISYYYLAGHFAAATAAWILSSILALLTLAPARLKMVMLG